MCRRPVQSAVVRLSRVEQHRGCISARGRAKDVRLVDVTRVVAGVAGDEGDLVVGDRELVRGIGEVDLPGEAYGLCYSSAVTSHSVVRRGAQGHTGMPFEACSVSGSTGASGTMSSLREMVSSVSLVFGPFGEELQFVATIVWAVATVASRTYAARHLRI